MCRDVLQALWPGVPDQQSQDTMAPRRVTDLGALLDRHAAGDELDESFTVRAEDTERAVAGIDQCGRRLDDPSQHLGEVEVGADRDNGIQQLTQPLLGAAGR